MIDLVNLYRSDLLFNGPKGMVNRKEMALVPRCEDPPRYSSTGTGEE